MRNPFFAVFAALVTLTSCTPTPTLEEQLAGKTPAEKRIALIEACHKEASLWSGPRRYSHAAHMHDICDLLAQECSSPSTLSKGK